MRVKKNYQTKNGFIVLVLDILFIAAGIIVIISNLLSDRGILSAMLGR